MIASAFAGCVRLACGCRPRSADALPDAPAIFIANHTSHLDGLVIWSSMPAHRRRRTRLVAARDYWDAGPIRRFISTRCLNALLIDRTAVTRANNPLTPMLAALERGESLVLFPEGTRRESPDLGEFRTGVYHLVRKRPGTAVVPTRLENLNRILPKGEWLPVPLIGAVRFGAPTYLQPSEPKAEFIERLRTAVLELDA